MRSSWTVSGKVACVCVTLSGALLSSGRSLAATRMPIEPLSLAAKQSASAVLTFRGSVGLAGNATPTLVGCNEPSLTGETIFLLASAPAAGISFNVHVSPGLIDVTVSSGSGSAYRYREFRGRGVTAFDASRGAEIHSPLVENQLANGQKRGSLGSVTFLTGHIDCGNQRAGTSTIVIRGSTADGPVYTQLDPVRVACNSSRLYGPSVQLEGILKVGTGRALLYVTLTKTSLSVLEDYAPHGDQVTSSHFYTSTATGGLRLLSNGATINATVKEGSAGRVLMMTGRATCGAFTTSR